MLTNLLIILIRHNPSSCSFRVLIFIYIYSNSGNCEEELPKKPVGQLSAVLTNLLIILIRHNPSSCSFRVLIFIYIYSNSGNCEEELPEKPVGQLSADS